MNGRQRLRVVIVLAVATVLVGLTVAYGLWLVWASTGGPLMEPAHMTAPAHPPMDHTMLGSSSSRGVLGGYLGTITGLMGAVFVILVALLAWLWLWERPGRPERGQCPACGATIETDWVTCAYCGVALASGPGQRAAPV